jgi:hypothetical protein
VAHAQNVRVVTDNASLWTATEIPILITTVKAGTVLEVRGRRDENWLLVVVPHDPNYRGRIGMILSTQVVPADGGTIPPPPTSTTRRAPPRGPTPPETTPTARRPTPSPPATGRRTVSTRPVPPSFVFGTAGYDLTKLHFTNAESFPALLEQATRDTAYQVTPGVAFDGGGGMGLARRLELTATVSWRTRTDSASVTEQVPNPILYNHNRTLTTVTTARRQEAGGHVRFAVVLGSPSRVHVVAGAGPSVFFVRQPIVSNVAYQETYPYDQIVFQHVDTTTLSKFNLGVNGQADVVVPITRRLGWQTSVRYSQGFLKTKTGNGEFTLSVGGNEIGSGLRVMF